MPSVLLPQAGTGLGFLLHRCLPGQVLVISICIVLHLFCEEKNYPQPHDIPPQTAVYSVHRWPQEVGTFAGNSL